jgi:hypothetical protein
MPAQTAGTQTTAGARKTAVAPTTAGTPTAAGTPTTAGRNVKSRERQQEQRCSDQQDRLQNFQLLFCCLLASRLFLYVLSSDLHLTFWFARVLA